MRKMVDCWVTGFGLNADCRLGSEVGQFAGQLGSEIGWIAGYRTVTTGL